MMGMILKVNVAVGDKVKAGDIVAVMGIDEDGAKNRLSNRRHHHCGQLPSGRNR